MPMSSFPLSLSLLPSPVLVTPPVTLPSCSLLLSLSTFSSRSISAQTSPNNMNFFFQSFVTSLSYFHGTTANIDMGQDATSDYDSKFLIDRSWPNHLKPNSTERPQSQEELRNPAKDGETEEEKRKTMTNSFDIAAIDNRENDDNDDDYNCNVRSEYEEKDHVYYVPPGAYRSYVLESCKNGKGGKTRDSFEPEQKSHEFEVVSKKELGDDGNDNSNITSDYQEKDFVYQMPRGTYRGYELVYWREEEQRDKDQTERGSENDELSSDVEVVDGGHNVIENLTSDQDFIHSTPEDSETEAKSPSSRMKEDIDDYLDMTTPQSMANRPQIPNEKFTRRNFCRLCRNFHYEKGKESDKRGITVVKKFLSWRKKPSKQPCAHCGFAIDRRSFLNRIFGAGKRASGTF